MRLRQAVRHKLPTLGLAAVATILAVWAAVGAAAILDDSNAQALATPADTAPPITTLRSDPAPNALGWNRTAVSVSFVATDDAGGSGVVETRRVVDGVADSGDDTLTISAEGTHVVEYASHDLAGNAEGTRSAIFKIDTTPPELSLDATSSYVSSATVRAEASDALSGLDTLQLRLDSGSWLATQTLSTSAIGPHTVCARAFDVAGNEHDATATIFVAPLAADVRFDVLMRSAQSSAMRRVKATEKAVPSGRFTYLASGTRWQTTGPSGWASGYLPGELWAAYALTGDLWFRSRATTRQSAIGRNRISATSTDIGIRRLFSYAHGFQMTGKTDLRAQALKGAQGEAARFRPLIGAVESRNQSATCEVIVDQLINVELLYWGADNGGRASWRTLAHDHALTTARDFVRSDGSVYHVVDYDPTTGQIESKQAGGGYSVDSMWSRGQAWAIHGFATAYRSTKDPALLETARKVADCYIAGLPNDFVPYWDFRAPDIPDAPRDSAAAAVAASGLIDLALLDPDSQNRARYESAARTTLTSLASARYLSTGSNPAILLHGTQFYWAPVTRDCGQSYGDYFFLEAMLRLRSLPLGTPTLPIRRIKASHVNPRAVLDGDLTTSWTASGKQWLEFDLGKTATVHSVGLAVRYGQSRSAGFKIYTSTDRRRWRVASAAQSSGTTYGLENYPFAPTSVRYVRIVCAGTTRGRVLRVAEANIR